MDRNKKTRILSGILLLAMVLSIIPFNQMPSRAMGQKEIVQVSNAIELRDALARKEALSIHLTKDIELEYFYYNTGTYARKYLVFWDGRPMNSETVISSDLKLFEVVGQKTIDLRGHNIELYNDTGFRGAYEEKKYEDIYVFKLLDGADLYMTDTHEKKVGQVWHHGSLSEMLGDLHFATANIFYVGNKSKLTIDGGNYKAGRSSKTWCVSIRDDDYSGPAAYGNYNGWAYNIVGGSVLVNNGGEAIINGGNFHGHYTMGTPYDRAVITNINNNAKTIINGGNFKATNNDIIYSRKDSTMDIKAGGFSTEKLKLRYGKYTSLSGDHMWRVKDVQPYLGMETDVFDERASFKYDGKSRDYDWTQGINFKKSSKKLEVIAGNPKVTLYDGPSPGQSNILEFIKENKQGEGYYEAIITKDANYEIKADIDGYFKEIGLGLVTDKNVRIDNLDGSGSKYIFLENGKEFSYRVPTEDRGLKSYMLTFTELDGLGRPGGQIKAYLDVIVVNAPSPEVEIYSDKNPVDIGAQNIRLSAIVDKKWTPVKYEWENLTTNDENDKFVSEGQDISAWYEFKHTDKEGLHLIQCTVTDSYGGKGSAVYSLQVGGEGTMALVTTDELIFKYNVNHNGKYLENIGGAVDNKNWEVSGALPPGMRFITNLGLAGFAGQPTKPGKYPVTVKAANSGGNYEKLVNIIVSNPVEITTNSIPNAERDKDYSSFQIKSTAKEYDRLTWTISEGRLPPGLSLGINNGEISGTPTISGVFDFTIRVNSEELGFTEKELSMQVDSRPIFNTDSGGEISRTVKKGYNGVLVSNLLKEGFTDDLVYTISNAGFPVTVDKTYSGHALRGTAPNSAKIETFTITAKNEFGQSTVTVNLTTSDAPTLKNPEENYVDFWVIKDKEIEAINPLKDKLDFPKGYESYEWIYKVQSYPKQEELEDDYGIVFNEDTGEFSGKPTKISKDSDSDYILIELKAKEKESNLEGQSVYLRLYIIDGEFSAPSYIRFIENKETSITIGSDVHHLLTIDLDGAPTSKVTLESGSLPPGFKYEQIGYRPLITGKTSSKGSYKFTLKATNSEGSKSQELTINIQESEKAEAPTISPEAGSYPEGDKFMVKFLSDESPKPIVVYSINGQVSGAVNANDEFDLLAKIKGTAIENSKKLTITAYASHLGLGKLDSDPVSFTYTLLEKERASVKINTASLDDGKVGTGYTTAQLSGTSSKPELDIVWVITGLPEGLSYTIDGKISGTPQVAGDFDVIITAQTEEATILTGGFDEEILKLHIDEADPNPAPEPVIDTHPIGAIYKEGAKADDLTVEASGDNLSYVWYKSQDKKNDTLEDDEIVGFGKVYKPSTDILGESYYYVLVTNSKDGFNPTNLASNVATIEVIYDAAQPYFPDEDPREYLFTHGTNQIIMEVANVHDEGVLSYVWYKMEGNNPDPVNDEKIILDSGDKDGLLHMVAPDLNKIDKYYAVVTNYNKDASGEKTSEGVVSPVHIVESTKDVRYEISFDPLTGNPDDIVSQLTSFEGLLENGLPYFEKEGYILEGWYTEKDGGEKISDETKFDNDATVYGRFIKGYAINIGVVGNGSASSSHTIADTGTEITLTAKADEGYKFKEWQVESGGVTIEDDKFILGYEDVVIKAIFEKIEKPLDPDPEIPETPNYKVIIGGNSYWTKGSGKDISMTSNGTFEKFKGLEIDGKLVDKAAYGVKEGSTIVTILADYLEGLSLGEHTIEFIFEDGSASGRLTVLKAGEEPPKEDEKPIEKPDDKDGKPVDKDKGKPEIKDEDRKPGAAQTGDSNTVAWLIALILLSLAGILATISYKRKKA